MANGEEVESAENRERCCDGRAEEDEPGRGLGPLEDERGGNGSEMSGTSMIGSQRRVSQYLEHEDLLHCWTDQCPANYL